MVFVPPSLPSLTFSSASSGKRLGRLLLCAAAPRHWPQSRRMSSSSSSSRGTRKPQTGRGRRCSCSGCCCCCCLFSPLIFFVYISRWVTTLEKNVSVYWASFFSVSVVIACKLRRMGEEKKEPSLALVLFLLPAFFCSLLLCWLAGCYPLLRSFPPLLTTK